MSDEALRNLERRARESGSVEDRAALLAARIRAGVQSPTDLRLAAYLRDPAARLALGADPHLRAARPSWTLRRALERYSAAGGVIEHRLFASEDLSGAAGHELVARETVRALGEGDRARAPGATQGRRVSLGELLGPRFDLARGRLMFAGPGDLLTAEEAQVARASAQAFGSSLVAGYAYAFSDPPYPLQTGSLVSTERLFRDVWTKLVGSFDPETVEAYAWTTDAWEWFEAGREWWGSYLWTVRPPGDRPWVGIAASATD